MLPLRSVGRSNGVMVSADKNLTTLIQKRHILTRTTILYIYIYIYMHIYLCMHIYGSNIYIHIHSNFLSMNVDS